VHAITGQTDTDYSVRQAAYDLRKLRAKDLVVKTGSTRRYQVPPDALRTITALTTLRDQVLAPLLGAVRTPRALTQRSTWTDVERDYETLRTDMQTLFDDLGIVTAA
jgi:hypothetical protein